MSAIVSRAQWGAPSTRYARISTPTGMLVLHHTVTPQWTGVRAPQNLERIARERGFNGISYNYVVTVDGEVFAGRGTGVVGAHTKGYNSRAHAIVLVGNFDADKPPEAMLDATAWLIRHGHARGWWPDRLTHGHRDVGSTACPGRHAYAAIADINRRAASSTAPQPIEQEDDETMRFDERSDRVKEWQHALNLCLYLTGGGYDGGGNPHDRNGSHLTVDGHLGERTADAGWHAIARVGVRLDRRSFYVDHRNPSSVLVGYVCAENVRMLAAEKAA